MKMFGYIAVIVMAAGYGSAHMGYENLSTALIIVSFISLIAAIVHSAIQASKGE